MGHAIFSFDVRAAGERLFDYVSAFNSTAEIDQNSQRSSFRQQLLPDTIYLREELR